LPERADSRRIKQEERRSKNRKDEGISRSVREGALVIGCPCCYGLWLRRGRNKGMGSVEKGKGKSAESWGEIAFGGDKIGASSQIAFPLMGGLSSRRREEGGKKGEMHERRREAEEEEDLRRGRFGCLTIKHTFPAVRRGTGGGV